MDGKVVRFERGSAAAKFARGVIGWRPKIVDSFQVAVRVPAAVPAVLGPDGMMGLLVGDKLMPINSLEVAQSNSSEVTVVTQEQWDRYERLLS